MGSSNRSPSYLQHRDKVRRWLANTKEGQFAVELFRQIDSAKHVSQVLDDDNWVDWGDVMQEHKHDLVIASDCAEHRAAAELAMQSSTKMAPPTSQGSKLMRFFSPPIWYVMRRQIERGDPAYWNHPQTVMKEALANPQWCVVPMSYIRGVYEAMMPKGEKIIATTS